MPLLEEAREADKVEQSDSPGKRRRANERALTESRRDYVLRFYSAAGGCVASKSLRPAAWSLTTSM
jgi:hypothetical protein